MNWYTRILLITLIVGNLMPFATNSALKTTAYSATLTIGHEPVNVQIAALEAACRKDRKCR